MSRKTASKCLKDFARYAVKHAKFGGDDEPKDLTKAFNGKFYCFVPLNPDNEWTEAAAPFLKEDGELPALIREINDSIRSHQIGFGVGIFFATPDENSLWRRLLKHAPGVIPDAPAPETKTVEAARRVSPQIETFPEHTPPGHA
ncbi:MAG: hypothetical protein WBK55_00875 [Alphaproteobacteria bacterium]